MTKLELTGKKFGKLKVISFAYTKNYRTFWNCVCDCGNECVVKGKYLSNGDTKSCGCLVVEQAIKMGKSNIKRNEYEYIDESTVKVKFSNNDNYFICDKNEWDLYLKDLTWFESNGYVRASLAGKFIFMHDLIMNFDKKHYDLGAVVDHINRDRTDNRLENLRIILKTDNMKNRSKYKNNKSTKTGVHGRKSKTGIETYNAYIQVNHKNINLGSYETFEEACKVRDEAKKKYHKIDKQRRVPLTGFENTLDDIFV